MPLAAVSRTGFSCTRLPRYIAATAWQQVQFACDNHHCGHCNAEDMLIWCTAMCIQLQANLLGSNTLPVASISVKSAPGGCYSCSYTAPYVAGLYVLEVTAGGKHLRGSPFSVKVSTQCGNVDYASYCAALLGAIETCTYSQI